MLDVAISRRLDAFAIDVTFRAQSGITALFGRSGAGKTSVINMLAGLLKPDEGAIRVDGEVLFDAANGIDIPPERRRLGYVFQESRLFPHYTVAGNLQYGLRRLRTDDRRIGFEAIVDLLELSALLHRLPRNLSGGERQRVAIGRALLTSPRLLLMDEPLANLDQTHRLEILPFIERLRDELAVAVVYVSHNMNEIVRLADTVVLLSDGRVAATGSVAEITSRLDLSPLTGRWDAGAVLDVTVDGQDETWALTRLAFAGGALLVPHLNLPAGERLRVRVRARDVSLALAPPQDISVLNILRGRIIELGEDDGPQIDVMLDVGSRLWARVTRKSMHELGLAPGKEVYALIKAIAVDRQSVGGRGV